MHGDPTNSYILKKWHQQLNSCMPITTDIIIYLKTTPKVAFERLKKRHRSEEIRLNMEYLHLLHMLYEQWIQNISNAKIITLNGDQDIRNIMAELNEKC